MTLLRALLAAALLGPFPAAAQTASPALEEGKPFPDLRLPLLEGGAAASISDFRGRKLLVLVFASW